MNVHVSNERSGVVPFSLKDAPSLIERVFPSTKVSAEAQKERKGVQSQTLTALGSYWKGRKPLFLVRACVLGCLLPSTDDPGTDLSIFEALLAIDDSAFSHRVARKAEYPSILALPYEERLAKAKRPEDLGDAAFKDVWPRVNAHLGTDAYSIPSLIEQLGIMRFGKRPVVADTFSGGGSIPFEASRMGCDVFASDLNPIACMLTWGAGELLSSDKDFFASFDRERQTVLGRLDARLQDAGFETASNGDRARIYLYCVEAYDHMSGWKIPLSPSWVLHEGTRTILKPVPDEANRCFSFTVVANADMDEYEAAKSGTVRSGRVVADIGSRVIDLSISSLRGDRKRISGEGRENNLRLWTKLDVAPRPEDVFGERLIAIKWRRTGTGEEYFTVPDTHDLEVEAQINALVSSELPTWQASGLVPSMQIEPGDKTDEPIRTRGWTYWHHLFNPRQLLMFSWFRQEIERVEYAKEKSALLIIFAKALNRGSRLCQWQPHRAISGHVFYNQALNTFFNYGCRAFSYFENIFGEAFNDRFVRNGTFELRSQPAKAIDRECDIYITDPPYADAVNYHEITEYFIAWLRQNPSPIFSDWSWDSRRRLAIKGKGEEFRNDMVEAYGAMARRMPDNGIQVVMFTHQDGKVWSDMTQIFWGAGLQVMADWYIATETTSELKKGGYVQGTHCIVLRKRPKALAGYSDEISQEVKEAVAIQIEEMIGLNQTLRGHGRSENVFNDADLQMAGYAAALRVLTSYAKIDGKDMTVEAMRPRAKNERTIVDDIIEYAVQVANEHLVPEGMDQQTWRRLTGTERFYLKMLDIESVGSKKVDNYQNFAKAFRVVDHGVLMASEKANDAFLKSARSFGKRQMGDDEFGSSLTRAVLYALWELGEGVLDDDVLDHLRGLVPDYLERRADLQMIARYISAKRRKSEPKEAENAEILAGIIRNERLG